MTSTRIHHPMQHRMIGWRFDGATKDLLDRIEASGRQVRRWKTSDGTDCGIFRRKGKWAAVGNWYATQGAIVFRCVQPAA